MKTKTYLYIAAVFFLSCSKDESAVETPLSNENFVLNFELSIDGEFMQGSINEASNTVVFNIQNANVGNITPSITISAKSDIVPSGTVPQDFSSPVYYTVTAENGDERTYEVIVNNTILNGDNQLISFNLNINGEDIGGIINEDDRTVTFNVAGADLDNLKPTLSIPERATISPDPEESQDFDEVVSYTILASDGTPAIYRVIVNNRVLSGENSITFFSATDGTVVSEASINDESGVISFDFGGFDKTNLTPTIEMSEYATISPPPDAPQDFTDPVTYTITAEDGTKFEYLVIANLPRVERIGAFSNPAKFFVGATFNIQGAFMDADAPDAQIYFYDGTNKFPIEILETSNYENGLMHVFSVKGLIPELTPTNENYKVIYEVNGIEAVSEFVVDIKEENAPLPLSVDKDQYRYNDELVISGESLTTFIAIPAPNGSTYLMDPRGSDITINENATEMRVILDIRQLFPSYYGDDEEARKIILMDEERRQGRAIDVNLF